MRRTGTDEPRCSAHLQALRRLARREHSEADLRRALLAAGHERHEVEQTLGRLRAKGLLDDRRFSAVFSRDRMAYRGLGQHRVRMLLRQRGVPRGAADEGLREALAEVPEAAVLDSVARRYMRSHPRDDQATRLQKLSLLLLRRGFPAGLIRERLGALWPSSARALAELAALEDATGADAGSVPEADEEPRERTTE
jgi:regulatory protein